MGRLGALLRPAAGPLGARLPCTMCVVGRPVTGVLHASLWLLRSGPQPLAHQFDVGP